MQNPIAMEFADAAREIAALPKKCFEGMPAVRGTAYSEAPLSPEQVKLLDVLLQFEAVKLRFIASIEEDLRFAREVYSKSDPVQSGICTTIIAAIETYFMATRDRPSVMEQEVAVRAERYRKGLPAEMQFLCDQDVHLLAYVLETRSYLERRGKTFCDLYPADFFPKPVDAFAFGALSGVVRRMTEDGVAEGKEGDDFGEIQVDLDASALGHLSEVDERPDSGAGAPEL